MKNNIYLTGFMGAGKSRLGREIAGKLQMPFIDTDKEIERLQNKTVSEIFEKDGEHFFREQEGALLRQISENDITSIVALGGGTLTDMENLRISQDSGLIIYIKSKPEALLERVRHSNKRPLLAGKSAEEMLELIKNMLASREKFYREAHIVFERDGYDLDVLLEKLEQIITRYWKE